MTDGNPGPQSRQLWEAIAGALPARNRGEQGSREQKKKGGLGRHAWL
jgi:hypothetical protein